MNIEAGVRSTAAELRSASDEAMFEAWLMMEKVTGLKRPVLLSHPERELSGEQAAELTRMRAARRGGVPLPYLLGEWGFYGHMFEVDPSVLIPRPETELLVERAAAFLKTRPEITEAVDVGTGSGCIAVSLLADFPELRCTGIDISEAALSTAVRNAERNGVRERFIPLSGDLTLGLDRLPRLICANLPYIPSETCAHLDAARFEPLTALDGGEDGFGLYRRLLDDIRLKAGPGTLILCELEYRQRNIALAYAAVCFPGAAVCVREDLAGLPRILEILTCDPEETQKTGRL